MKITLLIFLFLCSSPFIWSQSQTQSDRIKMRKAWEDSLWQVRNNFLNDSIFTNHTYQDSLFKTYKGLWKCVRIEKNRYGTVECPINQYFLFSDNKYWHLDYPCSMNGYNTDVHLRNDSIFFSTSIRVYIEKKRIEFRSDTLVIFSDRKYDESMFYVKQEQDTSIIAELQEKGFNKDCITGKWSLFSIGDAGSDEWVIQDGSHMHVPRDLNFESDSFRIEGIYLITSSDPMGKFEIIGLYRHFNAKEGETGYLTVKELQKRNGIIYHHEFYLVK